MTQPAVDPALESFSIARHAADPRADGGRRLVRVGATAVTIERSLGGVRMRVGVPTAAYRGLFIAVQAPSGRATLSLRHEDSELDVVLGSGEAEDVARSARAWSRVLGKAVEVEEACVTMHAAYARTRKRMKPSRRSAFSRRRKPGVAALARTSFAAEHEIIARD